MQDRDTLNTDGSLGIFTTVALILLVWAFCWFKSFDLFQHQQHINVLFKEVAGLRAGAPVFVDGVHAGAVENVNWKAHNQVLVRLRVTNPRMVIPLGAQYNILANAIIGARYIDITLPKSDDAQQEPVDESTIVMGGDVLRPEIILEKIGHDLDKVDVDSIKQGLSDDGKALRKAANQFSVLANKTMPVMDKALPLEDNLIIASQELRQTARRLDKFIDNPKISPELRKTISEAHETAQIAERAILDLNRTLTDKPLRQDLFDTMKQLNQSTCHLELSMQKLQAVTQDTQFRTDIKEILLDARKSLEKLDKLLNDPNSGEHVRATLTKTRSTLEDIDTAARQVQQILDKSHPLIHMFIGRPGHLKTIEEDNQTK